ncbi:MAG: fused MFS/spermidine synthase [Caldilineaceae bacterium]
MTILQRLLLLFIFFLTGIAALIYQVAWAREATLVFGVSVYAYSMVLAAFMGGMALGSFLLRTVADRTTQPLRLYALLQGGIALCGLLSPYVLPGLLPLYGAIAQHLAPTAQLLTVVRLLMALVVLLPPTFLMGGALPLMARVVAQQAGAIGSDVGRLYAADTLGAAVGSALTGLLLLRLLGTRETIWLAAALNLGCALLAWWLSTHLHFKTAQIEQTLVSATAHQRPRAKTRAQAPNTGRATSTRFLLWAYALSGFAALGYEIVWARILAIFTLNAVFSFAIMLTAFLSGLTLGGWLAAWWVRRRPVTLMHFGVLQLLVALSSLGMLFIFARLPSFTIEDTLGATALSHFIAFEFLLGVMTLLLPTTLLGMLFPVAASLYTHEEHITIGDRIGLLSACNTLAAIAGALVAGFLFIPWLGLKGTLITLALMNLLLGVIAAWRVRRQQTQWWRSPAVAVGMAALLLSISPAGYYLGFREGPTDQMIFYAEGVETTVAVFAVPEHNFKVSFVNGRIEVPTDAISMRAFRLLGHLPAVLRPDAERALMLSFGNGIATGSLNTHQIPLIDAVDLSAEQFAAAAEYWIENYNVLRSPYLHTHVEDGRNFLLQAHGRYDIITTDATHPVNASSWALFTEEFYRSVQQRLSEEGVFMQWLPFHSLTEAEYQQILRTFQHVFPHATLWYTGGSHTLLLATPQRLTRADLQSALQAAAAHPQLNDDLGSVAAIAADWIMDEDALRTYAGPGALVTDDNAYFLPQSQDTARLLQMMVDLAAKPHVQ